MAFYNTFTATYESVQTEVGEVIRPVNITNYPFKRGESYLVMGFLPSPSAIAAFDLEDDHYRFFANDAPRTEIPVAELPKHLEHDPLIGRRIVARRITSKGTLAEVTEHNSIIITDQLHCPIVTKQKK